MLVKNQLVKMRWSSSNKKHFINKLYAFSKMGDVFYVKAEDLMSKSKIKVKVECDYCGSEYSTSFSVYKAGIEQNGYNACSKCAAVKSRSIDLDKRKQRNYMRALETCKNNGYNLISALDDCNNTKNIIQYECPIHGVQTIVLDNFIRGHLCYKCGREAVGRSLRKSVNEVIKIVESKNNNKILNPNSYNSANDSMEIVCGSCGNIFHQSLRNYMRANLTGKCPDCNELSYGEYLISIILDKYNVQYIRQYKFENCKDKKYLPYDFYLPDHNLCIEFDGKHHYEPIYGETSFKICKLHDAMKNWYCKWNNIDLLRIPYWEYKNIEHILYEHLNRLNPNITHQKIKYISYKKAS